MVKKVLGSLFFVGALLMLIGSIANGSLFSGPGSAAVTFGNLVGKLIPVVLYVMSGLILITFDNASKMNYIDGFKKRSKQSTSIVVLAIVYGIITFICVMAVASAGVSVSLPAVIASMFVAMLPYFVPFIVFVCMWLMYARPHQISKKCIQDSAVSVEEYLSADESFVAYSDDNFVLASNKALFFPAIFCVVPFAQIASTKLEKMLWEQDVYFNLFDGKKFYIVTKHYDSILEAMNAHSAVQE